MSKYNLLNRFLSTILVLVFLFSSPNTISAFSISEEKQVGEKLLSIVRQQFILLDDPDISQYINSLGNEILDTAGPQFFDYHFFVINNREFNAFAAPSGLIFMHSGLIETMDNEEELYSVLAHECGHVISRHIAERIAKSKKISIATTALALAGLALGGGAVSEALIAGSMAAGQSLSLHFSRKDEEEADRLAYQWMKEKGRDPQNMLSMLNKMNRISKYRRGKLPPYLLTHPDPEMRVSYVQDLLYIDQDKKIEQKLDFKFQRIKARILSLTRDPVSLSNRYKKLLKKENSSGMANYGLALVYLAQAQYEEALASLNKVSRQYPYEKIILADKGVVHFQSGNPKEALKYFQKAHKADPNDLYSHYYLARTHQQLGNLSMAVGMYEELLPYLSDYATLYYQIGELKARLKQDGEAYYYLGIYHWYSGDSEKALNYLNKSIAALQQGNLKLKAAATVAKIEALEKKL